jgi:hypothetical protein
MAEEIGVRVVSVQAELHWARPSYAIACPVELVAMNGSAADRRSQEQRRQHQQIETMPETRAIHDPPSFVSRFSSVGGKNPKKGSMFGEIARGN